MTELLGTSTLLLTIGIALLWWYHGIKTRELEARAAANQAAVATLRSVNSELRAALDRVVADTKARNDREAQADAHVISTVTDPARAAQLLNELHQDRPGPGPRAGSQLPAGPAPKLPEA